MESSSHSASRATSFPWMLRAVLPRSCRPQSRIAFCDAGAEAKSSTAAAMPLEPEPTPAPVPEAAAPMDTSDPPVQFEMFSKEWQNMSQQDNWDGFRIEAANQVTKHMQAAHTLFLGTQLRECGYIYQFGPAFQSEDQRTMMVAKTGLDGGVNGRLIKKVGSGFELKASVNSHLKEQQRNMHEGSIEYTGSDWTGGAKLAWQGTWIAGASFTQKVLPSLQLGGDLMLIAMGGISSIGTLGLRWVNGKDILSAAVSRQPDPKSPTGSPLHECRLAYTRKCSERLSLGSELKFSQDMESGMSMAYEYTFRMARVQGMLDTDGKVSCCVSDFTGFGFSGMIDYFRGDYKFGMLMHVLPQQEQPPPP
mmetsp:Transcript_23766/g.55378  ORF Transcript_23766/g.55378 Transcript_23766/m.55378 type:complete len:363 (-) Transcript_23766:220-1308(-)|eukprot:CAMPEP_0178411404 /NCGR_PEP_ID=MMETSP0689_2-20121128/21477_1 /TAXON_ID=160604 /ORGANISM="Amphidinium massartii, Strain CS-259" /LENGTH=362 /DNA_ID=CAMNT_0020032609 /DNA_START=67 /DNA_END=1155 /DNA_ORIENTATION=-